MGPIAERVGLRWTVIFGIVMIALGLLLSSRGGRLDLYVGHGLFMGPLGNVGINAPLYIYIARWFDRRRGTPLALLASGQAVAGTIWAPLFGHALGWFDWRLVMQLYAAVAVALVVPVAFFVFGAPPGTGEAARGPAEPAPPATVLGMRPGAALGLVAAAGFLCCVPMAMLQAHLVAFSGDLSIPLTRGSTMLSLLLACAFIGRQFWGVVADWRGGLRTILYGSVCQAAAMTGFLAIRSEAGLFAVAFGLGFSGIIPAYVLAVRELFPAREAAWRVPIVMLCSGAGMAAGGCSAARSTTMPDFIAPPLPPASVSTLPTS
jgi:MFS family permease